MLSRCWYLVQFANGNVQIGIFICSLIPDCNQKQWNEWLATRGAANNTDTTLFLSKVQKLSSEGMSKIMKSQPEFISVLDLEFTEFALFLTSILEIYLTDTISIIMAGNINRFISVFEKIKLNVIFLAFGED